MATLKDRIVTHLESKGNYDPNVDDDMIDDLVYHTAIAKTLMKKLQTEGAILEYYTTSGSKMLKLSPTLNALQMVQRSIYQLSTKLGIDRSSRLKLKIIEEKQQDELDKLLSK